MQKYKTIKKRKISQISILLVMLSSAYAVSIAKYRNKKNGQKCLPFLLAPRSRNLQFYNEEHLHQNIELLLDDQIEVVGSTSSMPSCLAELLSAIFELRLYS